MNFAQIKKSLGQVVQTAATTAKDLSSQVRYAFSSGLFCFNRGLSLNMSALHHHPLLNRYLRVRVQQACSIILSSEQTTCAARGTSLVVGGHCCQAYSYCRLLSFLFTAWYECPGVQYAA